MQRYLEEEELEGLERADLRMLLSEQFEEHRRLREQAQNLIRTFVAAATVVAGIFSYALYRDVSLSLDQTSVTGALLRIGSPYPQMIENTVMMVIFFLVVMGGLLFMAFMDAVNVQRDKGTLPLTRHKEVEQSNPNPFKVDKNSVKGWILQNDRRIVETDRGVQQAYAHLNAAIVSSVLVLFLAFGSISGSVKLLGLIHLGLLVFAVAVAFHYLSAPIMVFIRSVHAQGVQSAIKEALPHYVDSMEHKGIGFNAKISLLILSGTIFRYSGETVELWIGWFPI